jgi:hypothetical protein
MLETHKHRGLLSLALLLLVPTFSACDDAEDEEEPDPAEAIEIIELTVGGVALRLDKDTGNPISGGPLVVAAGANATLTARFLDEDGNDVTSTLGEFELQGENATPSIVTYTATGDFTGTVAGVAAGAGIVEFQLFHTVEQHEDWGPHEVAITVQ